LWGYLKSGVYVAKTRNNEEFKVCVRDEIAGIAEVLRRGIKDFHSIFSSIYPTNLESFEMWCWRRMEKISWTDHVRNEDVLRGAFKF
jgi:hypothetical protein